jgi:hypothetical protein
MKINPKNKVEAQIEQRAGDHINFLFRNSTAPPPGANETPDHMKTATTFAAVSPFPWGSPNLAKFTRATKQMKIPARTILKITARRKCPSSPQHPEWEEEL